MKIKEMKYWPVLLFALTIVFTGCDTDEPDPQGAGETELITKITLTLTPQSGGTPIIAVADDPDGDGVGLIIDDLVLTANTTYTGTIEIRDDVNGEDITNEVRSEADEHQLWYTFAGDVASRVTVTITDTDSNNLPLGLTFTVAVSDGPPVSGTLNVVLSHYDETPKDGTTLSGESDIDIVFPVEVTLGS